MITKNNGVTLCSLLFITFLLAYFSVEFVFPSQSKVKTEKCVYRMPGQIINLSGTNGTRYLKIEIVIDYECSHAEIGQAAFETKKTALIDALIMWVSSKTITNIDGFENKEILKEEIRQKFQKILGADSVKIVSIYYQTFLVQ